MNAKNYSGIADKVFEIIRNLSEKDFESLIETLRMKRNALETAKGLPADVLRAALEIAQSSDDGLDLDLLEEESASYPGRS